MGRSTIDLAVDRGNTGIKICVRSADQDLQPFKIPSVLVKMDAGSDGLLIGRDLWICGDSALSAKVGKKFLPMDSEGAGKLENLAVVVAQGILKANQVGGEFYLNVAVSSPFAGTGSALDKLVQKEVSKLSAGFSANGKAYKPILNRVGSAHEGLVLLEVNQDLDGVIDMGFGTILGGFRRTDGKIQPVDSERGGCRDALMAMLADASFKAAIMSAGFSSTPSLEKLSSLFSSGRWVVKDFDFAKYLKPHVGIIKETVEEMATKVKSGIRNDNHWRESAPKIVLIGGAACILVKVLGDKAHKWAEGLGVEIYDDAPDFQTAMILSQLQKTNPERFASVEA